MKEIISSLDIGSDTVKLVVGEVFNEEVNVLFASSIISKGIKKGIIVNPEEALIAIKEIFSRCEEMLNTKIDKVILSVPSYYSEFIKSEGSSTITNEGGIVDSYDIVRTMQASVYNKIPNNKELINIMPINFIIDDEEKVSNPKGKKANKLKCEAIISLSPKKNVYTAFSILDSIGVSIVDIAFGSYADYFEYKDETLDKKIGAIINIGHEKTEVSIINKGIMIDTEILEVGGKNINKDLMYVYNIDKKNAIYLKEKFAFAHKRNASTSWNEDILTNDNENIKINQYEVSEVIYSRIKEILELSKKQINLLTKKEISYIMITGGTSELNDFEILVEEIFGKNTKSYKVKEVGCRHNKYSTCLGLIKYYYNKLSFRGKLAYTMDEKNQQELINIKNKKNTILGKIYGYFFNN